MNAQQREQADRVMAEAQRRGVPVSEALRDLVDDARAAAGEEPVTVRPTDLLRGPARRPAARPRDGHRPPRFFGACPAESHTSHKPISSTAPTD
ncbi:hypothetical protein ACLQ24_19505 [Micromonospora sp. DT4]|uniref:hypothetical protein n=1 Tax=Micromonospora sp. DT4 TaxID=3393438 RepID=UPI003CED5E91